VSRDAVVLKELHDESIDVQGFRWRGPRHQASSLHPIGPTRRSVIGATPRTLSVLRLESTARAWRL
jgi:hypothetical protein